jgi:predicted transcriptional regulator
MPNYHQAYRDRIDIVEDIILKLVEHGQLNQTSLISFCGLNLKKHRYILDELEFKGLIKKEGVLIGKRKVALYRVTTEGNDFCSTILIPYEKMFPGSKHSKLNNDPTNSEPYREPYRKPYREEERLQHIIYPLADSSGKYYSEKKTMQQRC